MLTAERLRSLLRYEPETGHFHWVVLRKGTKTHKRAGCVANTGYITIGIDGKGHTAHRLAWLYVHGCWPSGVIDHINGNRADNRIENLRDVTQVENMLNVHLPRKDNKSGYRGVSWHKQRGRFTARLKVGNQYKHLGLFNTAEQAHAAYEAAKEKLV